MTSICKRRVRRQRRAAAAGCAASVLAIALGACSTQAASGGGTSGAGGTINLAVFNTGSVTPPFSELDINGQVTGISNVENIGLLKETPDSKLAPALASSYSLSQDGKTLTFHLRKNLKWSDGAPFTSRDVLYTYNQLANPKTTSAWVGQFSTVVGDQAVVSGAATTLSGITAPDPYTVVVASTTPDASLIPALGPLYMMPAHILSGTPAAKLSDSQFFASPTVSMGPYVFVKCVAGSYIQYKANPHYYGGKPAASSLYIRYMTSDVALAALKTGEINLTQIDPSDVSTVQEMPGVHVTSALDPIVYQLVVNNSKRQFSDPRVRQAMEYAIDRSAIISRILNGQATPANTIFVGDEIPAGLNPYPYDPAKAKSLLAAAGWNPATQVSLILEGNDQTRALVTDVVQSDLRAVGIQASITSPSNAQLIAELGKLSWDMFISTGPDVALDPNSASTEFGCDSFYPGGDNVSHFCDKSWDSVMKQALATVDSAQRLDLYHQAATIENKDVPAVWLYDPKTIYAYRDLSGFTAAGDPNNINSTMALWSAG